MPDQTPVYAIAQLEVTDMEAFLADYAGPVQAINQRHGVEVLAGTPDAKTVEGTYTRNLTVILKFPSSEAQEQWYSDPDYQPLIARRKELTNPQNSSFIVAPALPAHPS